MHDPMAILFIPINFGIAIYLLYGAYKYLINTQEYIDKIYAKRAEQWYFYNGDWQSRAQKRSTYFKYKFIGFGSLLMSCIIIFITISNLLEGNY